MVFNVASGRVIVNGSFFSQKKYVLFSMSVAAADLVSEPQCVAKKWIALMVLNLHVSFPVRQRHTNDNLFETDF